MCCNLRYFTKENIARHTETERRMIGTHWVLTGVMRKIGLLPTIVPDGDNSSPNVLLRTGGTKSKSLSIANVNQI